MALMSELVLLIPRILNSVRRTVTTLVVQVTGRGVFTVIVVASPGKYVFGMTLYVKLVFFLIGKSKSKNKHTWPFWT